MNDERKEKRGRKEGTNEHSWMIKERKVGWMGGWICE